MSKNKIFKILIDNKPYEAVTFTSQNFLFFDHSSDDSLLSCKMIIHGIKITISSERAGYSKLVVLPKNRGSYFVEIVASKDFRFSKDTYLLSKTIFIILGPIPENHADNKIIGTPSINNKATNFLKSGAIFLLAGVPSLFFCLSCLLAKSRKGNYTTLSFCFLSLAFAVHLLLLFASLNILKKMNQLSTAKRSVLFFSIFELLFSSILLFCNGAPLSSEVLNIIVYFALLSIPLFFFFLRIGIYNEGNLVVFYKKNTLDTRSFSSSVRPKKQLQLIDEISLGSKESFLYPAYRFACFVSLIASKMGLKKSITTNPDQIVSKSEGIYFLQSKNEKSSIQVKNHD